MKTAEERVVAADLFLMDRYEDVPSLENEPRWMKLAVTAPAPAGCAMIRDVRTWHGGTPVRTPAS